MSLPKNRIYFFLVAPSVFILDRGTKLWMEAVLPVGDSIAVIPSVLHITHVHNYGAAFGLMQGLRYWLIAISIFCVSYLIYSMVKVSATDSKARYSFCMTLIAGGALGNLYDRIFFGYVVDFIDFRIWPVFNIADSAITIGVTLLIVLMTIRTASKDKEV